MKNLKLNKKYGIIAIIVVIVLCILVGAGIHEHNKPISPVVGNWAGKDIDMEGNVDNSFFAQDHPHEIKLQTYNNHTFVLQIHDNAADDEGCGKYTGKWEKTDDSNNNGDPIYALKLNKTNISEGYDKDDPAEYFTLGGKNNIIWIGPNNNQHLQAKLTKLN